MYVSAARNPYHNIDYKPISLKRARRDRIWMAVSTKRLNRWPASFRPPHILSSWSSWQIIHWQYLISANVQSPECMRYIQIVMKAQVKNRQFLTLQVTVKVRRAYNPSHYIRLNPACKFNSRCTSIERNCMLLLVFPLSDTASWRIHLVLTRDYAQHLNVSDN
jgi:hypothetical protein